MVDPSQMAWGDGAPPLVYASWGSRAIGLILDTLFVAIVGLVVSDIAGHISLTLGSLVRFVLSVAGIWYAVGYAGGSFGQTPGMMIAGVKLTRVDGVTRVGYLRAFLRYLIPGILGTLTLGLLAVLDYLWPLWDRRNQTLHDKAANTVAIRVPRLTFSQAIDRALSPFRRGAIGS
ncbi:MAG: RDD family protein [Acidimicrobiales bacterium]